MLKAIETASRGLVLFGFLFVAVQALAVDPAVSRLEKTNRELAAKLAKASEELTKLAEECDRRDKVNRDAIKYLLDKSSKFQERIDSLESRHADK